MRHSPLTTQPARKKLRWDKECYGDEVVQRLNSPKPSPNALRIKELIALLQSVSSLISQTDLFCRKKGLMGSSIGAALALSPLSDYRVAHPDVAPLVEEIEKIGAEISSLLWRYHWRPDIRIDPDGTLRGSLRWPQMDEETLWENTTVHWLLSDLEDSPGGKEAFVSFLKCQRCGSWFYAGRSGAKFCGNTCRVISHNQTDQARAERAAYMRKLRKKKANLKRGQARSRDSAPLVSRSRKSKSTETRRT